MRSAFEYVNVQEVKSAPSVQIAQREGVSYHSLEDAFSVVVGRLAYPPTPNLLAGMAVKAVENTSGPGFQESGAGATLLATLLDTGKRYSGAYMGDTRAWAIACDKATYAMSYLCFTKDHSPADPDQRRELESNGAVVMERDGEWRVMGMPDGQGGYVTDVANGLAYSRLDPQAFDFRADPFGRVAEDRRKGELCLGSQRHRFHPVTRYFSFFASLGRCHQGRGAGRSCRGPCGRLLLERMGTVLRGDGRSQREKTAGKSRRQSSSPSYR